MQQQTIRPHLSTPFPESREIWTCPRTGLKIPKTRTANLEYRQKILTAAENDVGMQKDLLAACRNSQLYWINTFVWTFNQFIVDPATGKTVPATAMDVPFITWPIQDDYLDELQYAREDGHDLAARKSRDMGASWCCTAMFHWRWLFFKKEQLLELSRVEAGVDCTGNMKALFQKHDYINQWLPEWMRPPGCLPGQKYRTKMHMLNSLNGSCIDGESTSAHAGTGDRRVAILLDEFSKVENGTAIRTSTSSVSPCRIVNSTPCGAGTEYSRWLSSGQIKVFVLPWWEHPQKGAGRTTRQDENGKWVIESPFYLDQKERMAPKEIAQELDMEDLQAGDVFFSTPNFERHIAMFAKEPDCRMRVDFVSSVPEKDIPDIIRHRALNKIWHRPCANGPLRVWCKLIDGRPDQLLTYRAGVDISKGQGASNSVISIKCNETNQKIMEWRDANTPPYDLARISIALMIWVGGRAPRHLPFLKWENNMPGWDYGKLIVTRYHYPFFYRRQTEGKVHGKETDSYGWHNGRQSKAELLSLYDRVMANGSYINPCKFALREAMYYIYHPDGSIGPAALVEENASARKTHGDCVIADALTLDDHDLAAGRKMVGPKAPYYSIGFRKKRALKAQKRKNSRIGRQRFDFTLTGAAHA